MSASHRAREEERITIGNVGVKERRRLEVQPRYWRRVVAREQRTNGAISVRIGGEFFDRLAGGLRR